MLGIFRYYIEEFSQRHVGWQLLPAQIFTASDIPLKLGKPIIHLVGLSITFLFGT